ncbi:sushi repeat-containing protein SRPX-like isoform X4 [Dysidea avara]|uniref:sushi repeat-containing protein SRPX-like isoform X4 n=1 Tax=Dysidea avara TaxID=196820 RepID=UPI0033213CF2
MDICYTTTLLDSVLEMEHVTVIHSGNLEGQSPYMTEDSSCSNCPDDKKSCVNNLCSNVSCPVLDPPNNGMIDCTSNEVGSTCTFKCNTGFELTSSASRTCQDNGTWSGTETTCTPDCSADEVTIDDISVARETVTVEFSSDPNSRFRCRLNNQRSRQCTSPVTYTGLSRGRYRVTVQAACPGQRFQGGNAL